VRLSIVEIYRLCYRKFKEGYSVPIMINDETYYRTREVCQIVGVSRSTLLRWLNTSILKDASHRDRRGWRLFTEADVKRIKDEANRIK